MFWSRSRGTASSGVRLRLDPLLEDRCVPCSGHELIAAAAAPAAVVAPPTTPAAVQLAPAVSSAGPAASVAPPTSPAALAAATPTQSPAAEGQSLVAPCTDCSEADPMLMPG